MRHASTVPIIVGLVVALVALPSFAAERTAVFQSDLTVPIVGTQSTGVLTVVYDDTTGEGRWSFDGTIDGHPASASGRGISVVDGGGGQTDERSFRLTMTSIEVWDMPGFDPVVPRTAAIRSVGSLAYVNYEGPIFSLLAIPVAVDPSLTFPIEGVYVLTNAGSGDDAIEEIPRTGAGPTTGSGWLTGILLTTLLVVAFGLLGAILTLEMSPRAMWRVRVHMSRGARRDVD